MELWHWVVGLSGYVLLAVVNAGFLRVTFLREPLYVAPNSGRFEWSIFLGIIFPVTWAIGIFLALCISLFLLFDWSKRIGARFTPIVEWIERI